MVVGEGAIRAQWSLLHHSDELADWNWPYPHPLLRQQGRLITSIFELN